MDQPMRLMFGSSRLTKLLWAFTLALIGAISYTPSLSGQVLTVRLLNAKSGQPMGNKNVTILWSPSFFSKVEVHLGKDGTAQIPIKPGADSFSMMEGPRAGKEPYRVAYLDCNESDVKIVSVEEVLRKGVVPPNSCSDQTRLPKPGEIVFWGLPRPWWQPDFQ
jgi:hypothetical protein